MSGATVRSIDGCLACLRQRRIRAVVIGASAGGVEALMALVPSIPAGVPFALVAIVHLPADSPSLLPGLLADVALVRVKEAEPWEPLRAGTLYIAPPGYHLSIEPDGTFSLSTEDPVNFSRPSIDVLFESAAEAIGEELVAVLLTGANADGAAGLVKVRDRGGFTIVQDPASAKSPEMPRAGLLRVEPDCLLSLDDLSRVFAAQHVDA